MAETLADHQLQAALNAVAQADASAGDKAEMLVEIALGLQQRPREPAQLQVAVELYTQALALYPAELELARARIRARRATALQMLPADSDNHGGEGDSALARAREDLEAARPALAAGGSAEELAECDLNLGLVLQAAGSELGPVVQAYQRALRCFSRERFPREYAIAHNNLATAYLSLPMRGDSGKMREAMAVQSFEAALSAVSLVEQPGEYAMLQNNLGNALQYAASGHPLHNNLRALEAYQEALKVRNERDTPAEYANTLANMANCLANLPDNAEHPGAGNRHNCARARDAYRRAGELFQRLGEGDKAALVAQALTELEEGEQEQEEGGDDRACF